MANNDTLTTIFTGDGEPCFAPYGRDGEPCGCGRCYRIPKEKTMPVTYPPGVEVTEPLCEMIASDSIGSDAVCTAHGDVVHDMDRGEIRCAETDQVLLTADQI